MLILSRKIGEAIIIGDYVSVVLLNVVDGRAVFGIKAPKDIEIYREEIYNFPKKRPIKERKPFCEPGNM